MVNMNKRKLRRKIANQVADKMMYMNTCLNERDIILNIILSKKDTFKWHIHCSECNNKNCASYRGENKNE